MVPQERENRFLDSICHATRLRSAGSSMEPSWREGVTRAVPQPRNAMRYKITLIERRSETAETNLEKSSGFLRGLPRGAANGVGPQGFPAAGVAGTCAGPIQQILRPAAGAPVGRDLSSIFIRPSWVSRQISLKSKKPFFRPATRRPEPHPRQSPGATWRHDRDKSCRLGTIEARSRACPLHRPRGTK